MHTEHLQQGILPSSIHRQHLVELGGASCVILNECGCRVPTKSDLNERVGPIHPAGFVGESDNPATMSCQQALFL